MADPIQVSFPGSTNPTIPGITNGEGGCVAEAGWGPANEITDNTSAQGWLNHYAPQGIGTDTNGGALWDGEKVFETNVSETPSSAQGQPGFTAFKMVRPVAVSPFVSGGTAAKSANIIQGAVYTGTTRVDLIDFTAACYGPQGDSIRTYIKAPTIPIVPLTKVYASPDGTNFVDVTLPLLPGGHYTSNPVLYTAPAIGGPAPGTTFYGPYSTVSMVSGNHLTGAIDDCIYFTGATPFNFLNLLFSTLGLTTGAGVWEYCTNAGGTTWTAVIAPGGGSVLDGTAVGANQLFADGTVCFVPDSAAWVSSSVTGGWSGKYAVRFRVTTAYVTSSHIPVISYVAALPTVTGGALAYGTGGLYVAMSDPLNAIGYATDENFTGDTSDLPVLYWNGSAWVTISPTLTNVSFHAMSWPIPPGWANTSSPLTGAIGPVSARWLKIIPTGSSYPDAMAALLPLENKFNMQLGFGANAKTISNVAIDPNHPNYYLGANGLGNPAYATLVSNVVSASVSDGVGGPIQKSVANKVIMDTDTVAAVFQVPLAGVRQLGDGGNGTVSGDDGLSLLSSDELESLKVKCLNLFSTVDIGVATVPYDTSEIVRDGLIAFAENNWSCVSVFDMPLANYPTQGDISAATDFATALWAPEGRNWWTAMGQKSVFSTSVSSYVTASPSALAMFQYSIQPLGPNPVSGPVRGALNGTYYADPLYPDPDTSQRDTLQRAGVVVFINNVRAGTTGQLATHFVQMWGNWTMDSSGTWPTAHVYRQMSRSLLQLFTTDAGIKRFLEAALIATEIASYDLTIDSFAKTQAIAYTFDKASRTNKAFTHANFYPGQTMPDERVVGANQLGTAYYWNGSDFISRIYCVIINATNL